MPLHSFKKPREIAGALLQSNYFKGIDSAEKLSGACGLTLTWAYTQLVPGVLNNVRSALGQH